MDTDMKKILITGSTGLVGSEAVSFFQLKGWKVTGIDNNSRSKFFDTKSQEGDAEWVDIRDKAHLDVVFHHDGPFDAIIHAAAQPSHDYATDHVIEDFEVNALGTVNLLEATRKHCSDAVFVYVSTDKVYGENMKYDVLEETETRFEGHVPFNESLGLDFAGDRSFFGCSKAAADMYAQQYAARGMKVGIFRPGCITGKQHQGAEQHGFLAYLVKCIKEGKKYKIFGFEGKQVRDQIHAYDLVNAFYHFIERPIPGAVYNIGGGPERSVSIIEAAKLIQNELGGADFFYEMKEPRKGDRVWDVHDVSKFRKDYPEWDYKYDLLDIMKDLCLTE